MTNQMMSSMGYRNYTNVAFDFLYPLVGPWRAFSNTERMSKMEGSQIGNAFFIYDYDTELPIIEGIKAHHRKRENLRTAYVGAACISNTGMILGLVSLL